MSDEKSKMDAAAEATAQMLRLVNLTWSTKIKMAHDDGKPPFETLPDLQAFERGVLVAAMAFIAGDPDMFKLALREIGLGKVVESLIKRPEFFADWKHALTTPEIREDFEKKSFETLGMTMVNPFVD